ncbi:50S ribosomal protein L13 [Candidatus Woesearchaeota archaeon]|nr:50S ribosomal protein L13 [Candidatus Woesearchaeota archaeon]
MIIIDANNLIAGRVASYAAKQSLLGEEIVVLNIEKCVLTGRRRVVLGDFVHNINRGVARKGPYMRRTAEFMFKRIVRGMVPYKRARGMEAYKRIMCYVGVPDQFKDKKAETIKGAGVEKLTMPHYTALGEYVKLVSGNKPEQH